MIPDPDDISRRFPDHGEFCRESLSVENKEGLLVPLLRGPAQLKLDRVIARLRAERKAVRIIYLKARQVWVTTGTASQLFHATPFTSGQHTLVLAHDEKTVDNVSAHYRRFAEKYKPFGGIIKLPELIKSNSEQIAWDNGSWIRFSTAANVNIGRSFTLHNVHFSEFPYYPDQASLMSAVMNALPGSPGTTAVIEGTARGVGDAFYKLWMKANDPRSGSEWTPIFFAWWEHPEYTRALPEAPEHFQASLSAYERDIQAQYRLTLNQLAWRRWKIETDLQGDADVFKQEYPANPAEAFRHSGRMRFSGEHIERMPEQERPLAGNLELEDFGLEKRLIFSPQLRGKISIFSKPIQGRDYVIGSDSALGIDANDGKGEPDTDFSAAHVLDRDTGEEVAVFHARVDNAQFGRDLWALGAYYHWAGIVPEANGEGLATVNELLNAGYPSSLIYHRMQNPGEDPYTRSDNIGWKTTAVSRPQLIDTLATAIRQLAIHVHHTTTLQELRTFIVLPNGRPEAMRGSHDDLVIALALAVIGIQQLPRRARAVKGDPKTFGVRKYGAGPMTDEQMRGERRRLVS